MYKDKKILCIIPARSGSKGLPRKNIRLLLGKPLIAWTIEAAKASSYIDTTIVSTEDAKIATLARKFGAEIPFMRPRRLARDNSKGMEVVLHAMNWLENHGEKYDLLMLLQPTSPLRKCEDIDKAIEFLFRKRAKAVISVCPSEHHPWWSITLTQAKRINKFEKNKIINKNRQDLAVFYRINGALYLAYVDYLRKIKSFIGNQTYAYIMPQERSIDIDTTLDFEFAEFLMRKGTNIIR